MDNNDLTCGLVLFNTMSTRNNKMIETLFSQK